MENLNAENEVVFALFTALVLIGIGFVISWLFLAARSRALLLPLEGVVAPFFGLPAVLFSLTAALFATSIWENYDAASRAVRSESQGIMSLISLANSIPALSSEGLSSAAREYARSVVEDEWQTLSIGSELSAKTSEKFVQLRTKIFQLGDRLNKTEFEGLVATYLRIESARATRLAFVTFDVHPFRWFAMIALGVLVQLAVAFVHIGKPKALIVAMTIATSTILIPVCMTAFTFSSPYNGVIEISNTPYLGVFR